MRLNWKINLLKGHHGIPSQIIVYLGDAYAYEQAAQVNSGGPVVFFRWLSFYYPIECNRKKENGWPLSKWKGGCYCGFWPGMIRSLLLIEIGTIIFVNAIKLTACWIKNSQPFSSKQLFLSRMIGTIRLIRKCSDNPKSFITHVICDVKIRFQERKHKVSKKYYQRKCGSYKRLFLLKKLSSVTKVHLIHWLLVSNRVITACDNSVTTKGVVTEGKAESFVFWRLELIVSSPWTNSFKCLKPFASLNETIGFTVWSKRFQALKQVVSSTGTNRSKLWTFFPLAYCLYSCVAI